MDHVAEQKIMGHLNFSFPEGTLLSDTRPLLEAAHALARTKGWQLTIDGSCVRFTQAAGPQSSVVAFRQRPARFGPRKPPGGLGPPGHAA